MWLAWKMSAQSSGSLWAMRVKSRKPGPATSRAPAGAPAKAAAKAKGDPYTLFVGTVDTQCMLIHFYPGWEVNPATDLIGVSPFMIAPLLISANPALPVSTISLAKRSITTARPRTARKSCTKMQVPIPMAANPANKMFFHFSKSEMDSWLRFHKNQAVPSRVSA